MTPAPAPPRLPPRLVIVSGLSGAGKSSILRTLEDVGFEAIDNPPLAWLDRLALERAEAGRWLAVGLDARTAGFSPDAVLDALARLHGRGLAPELVFAFADEATLLRRFTETRRRHPLAGSGRVADGIAAEIAFTTPLRGAAALLIDTSDLPLPGLRQLVEHRFSGDGRTRMLTLVSFAYPAGLPREADLVLDARFLRNPHYVPDLKPLTGRDPEVAAFVESDPSFAAYFSQIADLLTFLLPRFSDEGKKYVTIAVGCTGGRHRSVHVVEKLATHLTRAGHTENGTQNGSSSRNMWHIAATHRELARESGPLQRRAGDKAADPAAAPLPAGSEREHLKGLGPSQ